MKYNKSHNTIQNIGASFGTIATGFLIGLFVYGLLLVPQVMSTVTNIANAESLLATCSVTPISETTAKWVATVSGGAGSISYSWSGTEGLTNSTATVTKTYTTSGVKVGTVTIASGNSSASATCSIVINMPPPPPPPPPPQLSATCSVTPETAQTGATVTWTATPTGGTGVYTFAWSGTDNLSGSAPGITKSYTTAGTKTGSVTVVSGAQNVTVACSNSVVVTILPPSSQCSDGADNDGDTFIDGDDPACHSDGDATNTTSYTPSKDDENSIPVITLTGDASISLTKGDSFTDPGATADDEEDGDITSDIVVGGDTVDTETIGTYTITYDVEDSNGATAVQVIRNVIINALPSPPSPPSQPPPPASPPGGGGGGGGGGTPIRLEISNEKVEQIAISTALVTWDTNLQANGQVFYDTASYASSSLPFVEYAFSTSKTNTLVTKHSATITGLNHNVPYYFRPAAFRSTEEKAGIELMLTLKGEEGPTAPAICSEYLLEHIKFGEDNSVIEVTKLQVFLNDFEDFNLDITGIYDMPTFEAVEIFQERYAGNILDPWSIEGSTGYVYITTKKKINEIYCNKLVAFSFDDVTQEQKVEIEEFRALLESLRSRGIQIDTSKVGIKRPVSTPHTPSEFDTSLVFETEDKSSLSDVISSGTFESKEKTIDSADAVASVIGAVEAGERNEAIKRFLRNINISNFLRVLFHTVF